MSDSPIRFRAGEIQDALQALPEFDGIDVVVVRRKLLLSHLEALVAKSKAAGAAVLIGWESGRNLDQAAGAPVLETVFHIQVWTRPTLRKEEDPDDAPTYESDDFETAVMRALHNWQPPSEDHPAYRTLVREGRVIDDEKFLIRDIEVTARIDL